MSIESFLAEFESKTWENPLNEQERGFGFKDKGVTGYVMVHLYKFDGSVHLSSISSTNRKLGFASEAMKRLCAMADKYGVTMTLMAKPFGTGKDTLKVTALRSWYRKFGFVGGEDMVREPKGGAAAEASAEKLLVRAARHLAKQS